MLQVLHVKFSFIHKEWASWLIQKQAARNCLYFTFCLLWSSSWPASMILGECGTRDLDKLDGSCTTSKSQSDQGIAHCCQNCLFYNKVKLLTIKLKMDNKPTCKLLMFTAMPYWSSFILICRPQSDWSSETWNLETHMIQKMRHLSLPKITWHWQELSLNSELEPQIYCNQKT
jgi:hypothetical protein